MIVPMELVFVVYFGGLCGLCVAVVDINPIIGDLMVCLTEFNGRLVLMVWGLFIARLRGILGVLQIYQFLSQLTNKNPMFLGGYTC